MAEGRAGAVLLAAGRGTRMGQAVPDKLWADLAGRPVLAHALGAFERSPAIDVVVLAARVETLEAARRLIDHEGFSKVVAIVLGGDRRRDSVLAGLDALPLDCDVVLVHDAARPLVDADTIAQGVRLARQHGAALPALPVADTIKRVRDGLVVDSPPRSELWGAQTPQSFRVELLRRAHAAAEDDATDDGVLVERLGHPVIVYPGARRNMKITVADDLIVAEALLRVGT